MNMFLKITLAVRFAFEYFSMNRADSLFRSLYPSILVVVFAAIAYLFRIFLTVLAVREISIL